MSSEALERANGVLDRTYVTRAACEAVANDVLALLAEVARLEQERDEALSVREGLISPVQKVLQLRDALAVAREREQRAVEALREAEFSQCGWAGGCPVCAETPDEWAPNRGHRPDCKLGAALVDEPAAATEACHICGRALRPLDEPGAMFCPAGHPPAAATLAEPGRRDASTPAVGTGDASLPGSASAAADEPGETPT